MSHKIEHYNQDTVESGHENMHCSQDVDASTQSKIYGLNLKGGLDLTLGLGYLKVQFIKEIRDFYLKLQGQIWDISQEVNSQGVLFIRNIAWYV